MMRVSKADIEAKMVILRNVTGTPSEYITRHARGAVLNRGFLHADYNPIYGGWLLECDGSNGALGFPHNRVSARQFLDMLNIAIYMAKRSNNERP